MPYMDPMGNGMSQPWVLITAKTSHLPATKGETTMELAELEDDDILPGEQ